MKNDIVFTYIEFDKPIYNHLYGVVNIPVKFNAYFKPTSVGYFSGNLLYNGHDWELICNLLENSAKVVFHKNKKRQKEMIEELINSIEFAEVTEDIKEIMRTVGNKFEKTLKKWQKRMSKMLEYNKLYIMVEMSQEAKDFLKNSTLTYAKFGAKTNLILVFRHPDMDWIITLWSEEFIGLNSYRKISREVREEKWDKHLLEGDVVAITRLIKQGYYEICCRAAKEIMVDITGFCFAESAQNNELYPSLVKRRLIRSLMK